MKITFNKNYFKFLLPPKAAILFVHITKKPSKIGRLLRRERDSNPRRCDPQRFSRPPQSTTLPSLQCRCFHLTCANLRRFFELCKFSGKYFYYFYFPHPNRPLVNDRILTLTHCLSHFNTSDLSNLTELTDLSDKSDKETISASL